MIRRVHRPARTTVPPAEAAAIELAPPPQMGDAPQGGFPIQTLLPVLGAISSVTMMTVMRRSPIMVLLGGVILMVALGGALLMAFTQRGNAARQRRVQRERYLDYLESQREAAGQRLHLARVEAGRLNPEPAALLAIVVDEARRWERRRSDLDFLQVRVGIGDLPATPIEIPEDPNPVQPYDPLLAAEASAFARDYSTMVAAPVTVDVRGPIAIVGPPVERMAVVRALVAQIAALHSPDDVQLAACYGNDRAGQWAGFDLLPHVVMDTTFDGPSRARRVAPTADALAQVIATELTERAGAAGAAKRAAGPGGRIGPSTLAHLVVLMDDDGPASPLPLPDVAASPAELAITEIHLVDRQNQEPANVAVRITTFGAGHPLASPRASRSPDDGAPAAAVNARIEWPAATSAEVREPLDIVVDSVPIPVLAAIGHELSPLRLTLRAEDRLDATESITITELLGISDVRTLDPNRTWRPRAEQDFLRVPIGLDDLGAPLLLDIKESAQLGMGPHGICIGATGSGKSEMLRTMVLALAISHPPEDLAMVLVDYKGGAAFAPFAGLGHVAGIIDNLADDPQLTERARASINGEVVRRQKLLRDADSSPSIVHYRQLRIERPDLPPMPHLLLIIDEFGELLTAEPEFVDLLLTIGRIGRSIGVHLLLSSQRIEAGKLRGLDTYLSYRLGLRTFSEAESSVVLNTPDAFHLPAAPGYGYLKVDTSIYRRFRAGYVSGPIPDSVVAPQVEAGSQVTVLPVHNTLARGATESEPQLQRATTGRTLIDEAVDRIRTAGRDTAPIWLPPLPERLTLSRVIGGHTDDDGLAVVMGLLDEPAVQRQEPWLVDLTRGGGHAAIIGAPQSGRTTFLRTMAASLALTHTPAQVAMYGMDVAGNGLARLEAFPHVGGVATRGNRERLGRLVDELAAMIKHRENVFRDCQIDSMDMLRSRHAAGTIPDVDSADVVVFIDGFSGLRTEFDFLYEPIQMLLQRGGSFGIHLVLGMTRWNELKLADQALVGQRFELRLNDPQDSVVGRKLAETLKPTVKGRVLTEDKLFAQVALPVLEDVEDAAIGDELAALAQRSAESWQGARAAPIRLLPEHLDPADLPAVAQEPDLVPFGLRQDTMAPVYYDVERDQHLVVFGDTQCGKSSLLRGLATGLTERYSPEELVLAVMDVRGGLDLPGEYVGGLARSGPEATGLANAVAQELAKRSGKAGGPRIVVVVDDYDILASSGTDPLRPLLPYLPSARDLRFHVWLTRPVAGASRALFDPVLQAVRDTGGVGLVMSGERSEGQIFPKVFAEQMVPGRGRLVRRATSPVVIQVADFSGLAGADDPDLGDFDDRDGQADGVPESEEE